MMNDYYVGDFDSSTLPGKDLTRPKVQFKLPAVAPPTTNKNTGASFNFLWLVMPLLILGLTFALHNFAKKD